MTADQLNGRLGFDAPTESAFTRKLWGAMDRIHGTNFGDAHAIFKELGLPWESLGLLWKLRCLARAARFEDTMLEMPHQQWKKPVTA